MNDGSARLDVDPARVASSHSRSFGKLHRSEIETFAAARVMDFNRAFNPPCVWTAFATCPLPSRDNRLDIVVEAGERYGEH